MRDGFVVGEGSFVGMDVGVSIFIGLAESHVGEILIGDPIEEGEPCEQADDKTPSTIIALRTRCRNMIRQLDGANYLSQGSGPRVGAQTIL